MISGVEFKHDIIFHMNEGPEQITNEKIERALKLHVFQEQEYDECPPQLKTVEGIKKALESRWVTIYGIKKIDDNTYTLVLADENIESSYQVSGLREDELLDVFNSN